MPEWIVLGKEEWAVLNNTDVEVTLGGIGVNLCCDDALGRTSQQVIAEVFQDIHLRVHLNESFAETPPHQLCVCRMSTVAVMHHRKAEDFTLLGNVNRYHHVCRINAVDKVGADAIGLTVLVNLACFLVQRLA